MSYMIEMPDGEYIVSFCFEDALEAVEKYAGRGLRDFIGEYLQDNVDEAGAERLEAEEAMKGREMDPDHYRKVLLAVEDGLETMLAMLNNKRLGRIELRRIVAVLRSTINDLL